MRYLPLTLLLVLAGCDTSVETDAISSASGASEVTQKGPVFGSAPAASEIEFDFSQYDGIDLEFEIDAAAESAHEVVILGSSPTHLSSREVYTRFEMTPKTGGGYDLTVYWPGVPTKHANICFYSGSSAESLQKNTCRPLTASAAGAASGVRVGRISVDGLGGGYSGDDDRKRVKSVHVNGPNSGVDYPPDPDGTTPLQLSLDPSVAPGVINPVETDFTRIYLEFDQTVMRRGSVVPQIARIDWANGETFTLLKKDYVTN